jgi:aerobic C4-dicarboxylate transport protein
MADATLPATGASAIPHRQHRPWYTILYVQVLIAIAIGILIGHFFPKTGVALKPLGDGFIALIKMMIAPVIFCTVVHGIASMSDLKKVGRVGLKTLVYFEVVSSVALLIGLIVGRVLQPGKGFNIDPATLDANAVANYVSQAKEVGIVKHLLSIIPDSFFDAFAKGDLLQVLLVSILTGFAISRMGAIGEKVAKVIDTMAQIFFGVIKIIVHAAPLGAFGAMAFTVGAFGVGSLWKLIELVLTFYFTSALFVLLVLGGIARFTGFSILRFIGYIKDELLIVVGTSSSETVLPQMIQKMQRLGASKSVVGLVIPTGYSFNLDGTNIYMTLATLFLAQATNFTVSQISPLRTSWHCSLTARASRQSLGEGDDQASAHGGDRIWNVALGPQRRRRGVGNRRERQVLRIAWGDEVLRGESSPARRPRSRKSRCTSWRDGGSHAILGLRNVRARPPA